MSMNAEREELHRMIDRLPDGKLHAARELLENVRVEDDDPVRKALANAPIDDEPLTDEERERIRRADEDFKYGRTTSMDEVKKELGL